MAPAAATRGASACEAGAAVGEQGDVEPGEVGGGGVLDHDLGAVPGERAAGRAGRREVAASPSTGKSALGEQPRA